MTIRLWVFFRIAIVAVLQTLPFGAHSSGLVLKIDSQLNENCSAFYSHFLPNFVKSGEVYVTTHQQIYNALEAMGQKSASQIREIFERAARNTTDQDLKSLFQTIDEQADTRVAFCLLSPGCRLVPRFEAVHAKLAKEFNVEGEKTVDKLPGQISAHGFTKPKITDVIILKVPTDATSLSDWLISYIEENSHFVDFRLVDSWVSRNVKKVNNHQEPDRIFKSFARVEDGQAILGEGFLRTLLEGSAQKNKKAFVESLGLDIDTAQHNAELKSLYDGLFSSNKTVQRFLRDEKITPASILDHVRAWKHTMADTASEGSSAAKPIDSDQHTLALINDDGEFPALNTPSIPNTKAHRPGLLTRIIHYFSRTKRLAHLVKPYLDEPGPFVEHYGKPGTMLFEKFWDGTPGPVLALPPEHIESLPVGTPVFSIFSGKRYIKGQDYLDLDTRGGTTVFGLRPQSHLERPVPINLVAERVKKTVQEAGIYFAHIPELKKFETKQAIAVMTGRFPKLQKPLIEYIVGRKDLSSEELARQLPEIKNWLGLQFPHLRAYLNSTGPREKLEWASWARQQENSFWGAKISVLPQRPGNYESFNVHEYDALRGAQRIGGSQGGTFIQSKPTKNYYETLRVAPGAGLEEIKKSFRKLARETHPDINKDPDSEEKFKAINEAYEVLSDSQKRAQYDSLK